MQLKCDSCERSQLEMCPYWKLWVQEEGYDPRQVVPHCPDYKRIT